MDGIEVMGTTVGAEIRAVEERGEVEEIWRVRRVILRPIVWTKTF